MLPPAGDAGPSITPADAKPPPNVPREISAEARKGLMDRATRMLGPKLTEKPPKLFIIVGAGISMASADAPGWWKLLNHCIDFAASVCIQPEREVVLEEIRELMKGEELLAAAERLQGLLTPSEFAEFLAEQFGKYHNGEEPIAKHIYSFLYVLHRLGARIATTNYDTIIEDTLGLGPVDWMDDNVRDFFDSDTPTQDRQVLHIHGVYNRPKNVIFGTADYKRISADSPAPDPPALDVAARQKQLHFEHCLRDALYKEDNSVLFLGCGGTMTDPHFDQLFKFAHGDGSEAGSRGPRHVLLCSDEEFFRIWKTNPYPSIRIVPYGSHDQLGGAIKALFGWAFVIVDAFVGKRESLLEFREKSKDHYDGLKNNFPDRAVFLCPTDGIADRELIMYQHVFLNFQLVKSGIDGKYWSQTHRKESIAPPPADGKVASQQSPSAAPAIQPPSDTSGRGVVAAGGSSSTWEPSRQGARAELLDLDDAFEARIVTAVEEYQRQTRLRRQILKMKVLRPDSQEVLPSPEAAFIAFCQSFKDSWKDRTSRRLIHYLVMNEVTDMLDLIVSTTQHGLPLYMSQHSFDVNDADKNQMTPAHIAVFMNHIESLKTLLRANKLDLSLRDIKGWTPFGMAFRMERHECLRLLAKRTPVEDIYPPNMKSVLRRLKSDPLAKIYTLPEVYSLSGTAESEIGTAVDIISNAA